MKLSLPIVVLATITLPCLTLAAGDGKARARRPQAAGVSTPPEALKPFDKNGNQQIDADELPAVQQAFTALGKLDKNSNGQIEPAEITPPKPAARTAGRARAGEALKRVDKNGNSRIDPDEIEGLQQMLAKAPAEMMKKLDQNGNGKLEENEVARLNERFAKGRSAARTGSPSASAPSFRKPPEKSPDTAKPAETIKPAEKTGPAEDAGKPETPPNKFGS